MATPKEYADTSAPQIPAWLDQMQSQPSQDEWSGQTTIGQGSPRETSFLRMIGDLFAPNLLYKMLDEPTYYPEQDSYDKRMKALGEIVGLGLPGMGALGAGLRGAQTMGRAATNPMLSSANRAPYAGRSALENMENVPMMDSLLGHGAWTPPSSTGALESGLGSGNLPGAAQSSIPESIDPAVLAFIKRLLGGGGPWTPGDEVVGANAEPVSTSIEPVVQRIMQVLGRGGSDLPGASPAAQLPEAIPGNYGSPIPAVQQILERFNPGRRYLGTQNMLGVGGEGAGSQGPAGIDALNEILSMFNPNRQFTGLRSLLGL